MHSKFHRPGGRLIFLSPRKRQIKVLSKGNFSRELEEKEKRRLRKSVMNFSVFYLTSIKCVAAENPFREIIHVRRALSDFAESERASSSCVITCHINKRQHYETRALLGVHVECRKVILLNDISICIHALGKMRGSLGRRHSTSSFCSRALLSLPWATSAWNITANYC